MSDKITLLVDEDPVKRLEAMAPTYLQGKNFASRRFEWAVEQLERLMGNGPPNNNPGANEDAGKDTDKPARDG